MSCRPLQIVAAAVLVPIVLAACSKKDADSNSSPATHPTPATTQSTPATTQASAPTRLIDQDKLDLDDRAHPVAYVSVNGLVSPEIPQGWPLTIRARVLGGRDQPITFAPDDLSLKITDDAGSAITTWPLKRVTAPPTTRPATAPVALTMMASEFAPAPPILWIATDTAAIPLGTYRVTTQLNGAAPRTATVRIVAAPAQLTPAQAAAKFSLTARAALNTGDPQTALKLADARLADKPADVPALHVKADALAALGRRDEAARAYRQAITLFAVQNPKAPEPPLTLLHSLQAIESNP